MDNIGFNIDCLDTLENNANVKTSSKDSIPTSHHFRSTLAQVQYSQIKFIDGYVTPNSRNCLVPEILPIS